MLIKSYPQPEKWKMTTLGEVAEIFGGGTPKTDVKEYWDGDIPWLSVTDFNNDNRWVEKTEKTITKEGLKNSATKLLDAGDLIISARGTVGAFAQLKIPMAFNQSCYGLRAKEDTANDFLFYLLKQNIQQVKKNVHGAVFDTITRDTFDQIEFLLPSLPEQRAIAAVLSSLDDKIELLREQNKTLEATAQAVFKEWFAAPSEVLAKEGELPKGWRVGKLGDEFEILMGQSPKGESYNETGNGVFFFQGRTDFGFRFPSTRLYTTEPARLADRFDTLVSVRAPVGDINMAFDTCCIGRGVAAVKSKFKSYAYYKIKTLRKTFEDFEGAGTVFGSMTKNDFNGIETVLPDQDLIAKFDQLAAPLDAKIFNNSVQIQTLSKLRDTLLPKLMSGEIRVNGRSI